MSSRNQNSSAASTQTNKPTGITQGTQEQMAKRKAATASEQQADTTVKPVKISQEQAQQLPIDRDPDDPASP